METQTTTSELIARLKAELVFILGRVNAYAEKNDSLRNHVNYGAASQSGRVLCFLGQQTFIHFWEDEAALLRIEKLVINGEQIPF